MVSDEEKDNASNDEEHDNEHKKSRPPGKPLFLLRACTF